MTQNVTSVVDMMWWTEYKVLGETFFMGYLINNVDSIGQKLIKKFRLESEYDDGVSIIMVAIFRCLNDFFLSHGVPKSPCT